MSKIFYVDKKPVQAGGILFYRYFKYRNNTRVLKFLMINNNNKNNKHLKNRNSNSLNKHKEYYEDFGGVIDDEDKCIQDTVIREGNEESNNILSKYLNKSTLENCTKFYHKRGKYLFYLVEMKNYINPKLFGDLEIHDNIPRVVEWVSYKKYKILVENNMVSPRLYCKDFISYFE